MSGGGSGRATRNRFALDAANSYCFNMIKLNRAPLFRPCAAYLGVRAHAVLLASCWRSSDRRDALCWRLRLDNGVAPGRTEDAALATVTSHTVAPSEAPQLWPLRTTTTVAHKWVVERHWEIHDAFVLQRPLSHNWMFCGSESLRAAAQF